MSDEKVYFPPVGIKPKYVWIEERINDILNAMQRYAEVDYPIHSEWVEELRELLTELSRCKRK